MWGGAGSSTDVLYLGRHLLEQSRRLFGFRVEKGLNSKERARAGVCVCVCVSVCVCVCVVCLCVCVCGSPGLQLTVHGFQSNFQSRTQQGAWHLCS